MAQRMTRMWKTTGVRTDEGFKVDKEKAASAAFDLLCGQDKEVRERYRKDILNAKTQNEVRCLLSEVRQLI